LRDGERPPLFELRGWTKYSLTYPFSLLTSTTRSPFLPLFLEGVGNPFFFLRLVSSNLQLDPFPHPFSVERAVFSLDSISPVRIRRATYVFFSPSITWGFFPSFLSPLWLEPIPPFLNPRGRRFSFPFLPQVHTSPFYVVQDTTLFPAGV